MWLYVGHDKIKALNDVSFAATPGSSCLSTGMRAIIGRYGPLDVGLPPSPGTSVFINVDMSAYLIALPLTLAGSEDVDRSKMTIELWVYFDAEKHAQLSKGLPMGPFGNIY